MERSNALFLVTLFILLTLLFYWYTASRITLVGVRDGELIMSDLAYHLALAKDLWFGEGGNSYAVEVQRRVMSSLTGTTIDSSMPVGISPIGFLIWAPCAALVFISMELASAVWMAFSLTIVIAAVKHIADLTFPQERSRLRLFFYLLIFIILVSQCGVTALLLGQTSLFATALLMFILSRCFREHEFQQKGSSTLMVIATILISIKPSYALFAVVGLVLFGRWYRLTLTCPA